MCGKGAALKFSGSNTLTVRHYYLETNKIVKGKTLFLILFTIIIIFKLAIATLSIIKLGSYSLDPLFFEILLTVGLFILTYKGSRTIKWVLLAYCVFNSVRAFSKINSTEDFLMVGVGGLYIVVAVMILFNSNISGFLEGQKNNKNAR